MLELAVSRESAEAAFRLLKRAIEEGIKAGEDDAHEAQEFFNVLNDANIIRIINPTSIGE